MSKRCTVSLLCGPPFCDHQRSQEHMQYCFFVTFLIEWSMLRRKCRYMWRRFWMAMSSAAADMAVHDGASCCGSKIRPRTVLGRPVSATSSCFWTPKDPVCEGFLNVVGGVCLDVRVVGVRDGPGVDPAVLVQVGSRLCEGRRSRVVWVCAVHFCDSTDAWALLHHCPDACCVHRVAGRSASPHRRGCVVLCFAKCRAGAACSQRGFLRACVHSCCQCLDGSQEEPHQVGYLARTAASKEVVGRLDSLAMEKHFVGHVVSTSFVKPSLPAWKASWMSCVSVHEGCSDDDDPSVCVPQPAHVAVCGSFVFSNTCFGVLTGVVCLKCHGLFGVIKYTILHTAAPSSHSAPRAHVSETLASAAAAQDSA